MGLTHICTPPPVFQIPGLIQHGEDEVLDGSRHRAVLIDDVPDTWIVEYVFERITWLGTEHQTE